MPSPELKPCPFCGGVAELSCGGDEYELWAKVECADCDANIVASSDYQDRDTDELAKQAVAAWNRRSALGAGETPTGKGVGV